MAVVDRTLRGALGLLLTGLGASAQTRDWRVEGSLGLTAVLQKNDPRRETTLRLEAGAGVYRDIGAQWRLGCGLVMGSQALGERQGSDPFLAFHVADLVFQPGARWAFRVRGGVFRLFREYPAQGLTLGAAADYHFGPDVALSLAYSWAETDLSSSVPGDPAKYPKDAFERVTLAWRKRF